MDLRLISDTASDLTKEMIDQAHISLVPFKIDVGEEHFVDNWMDTMALIRAMKASEEGLTTSCPSPHDYLEALRQEKDGEGILILTISSRLSGSFNAAKTAKDLFAKECDTPVYVLDSKSAGAGPSLLLLKLGKKRAEVTSFEEWCAYGEELVKDMETFFVLESMENLRKNGRLGKVATKIATALQIRPIMHGRDGEIELYELTRGFKRALKKLADVVGSLGKNPEKTQIYITHVNAEEKAQLLKEKILEKMEMAEIVITPARGLSTAYGDDGGIIIAF